MNDIKITIAKQKEINDLSQLYLNALMEIDKLRDNKIKYNCIGCERPSNGMPNEGHIDCSHADVGCSNNLNGRWTCDDCYGKKIIKIDIKTPKDSYICIRCGQGSGQGYPTNGLIDCSINNANNSILGEWSCENCYGWDNYAGKKYLYK